MFHRFQVFLFLACLSFTIVKGQDPDKLPETRHSDKEPMGSRWFISPDLGLQFGTVTLVYVAPKVGYRLTQKTSVGVGATYTYFKDNSYQAYGYTYEDNVYGGSIFMQHQLFKEIQAYAQYELLSMDVVEPYTYETRRDFVPSFLVGGGYFQPIGSGNSSVGIMVLFDLLEGPNSLYDNPVFRVGFNIGL